MRAIAFFKSSCWFLQGIACPLRVLAQVHPRQLHLSTMDQSAAALNLSCMAVSPWVPEVDAPSSPSPASAHQGEGSAGSLDSPDRAQDEAGGAPSHFCSSSPSSSCGSDHSEWETSRWLFSELTGEQYSMMPTSGRETAMEAMVAAMVPWRGRRAAMKPFHPFGFQQRVCLCQGRPCVWLS